MTHRLRAAVVLVTMLGLAACRPAPETQLGGLRTNILIEKPGSEPVAQYEGTPVYYPCAVLTNDVIAAAGLKYTDHALAGGTRLSPGADRPELAGTTFEPISCGGHLQRAAGRRDEPEITLTTLNVKLSSASAWRLATSPQAGKAGTANGVEYRRRPDDGDDEVTVAFTDGGHGAVNAFTLEVDHFSAIADGETVLAKLIDGITRNVAAGPRPMPEHRYPEPYQLTAEPCDAMPPEVFTAVTGLPTDGLQKDLFSVDENYVVNDNAVQITCQRVSLLDGTERDAASLSVEQTIYAAGPAVAAGDAQRMCAYDATTKDSSPLPGPVGDVSCGAVGDSVTGGATVYFHVGRALVRVSLTSHEITGSPAVAKVAEGAKRIYALLNH
ncbi:hypothetical protein H4696_000979 [Amycolatopsis lexingtonensis]|uniref:DUF3558 domain-containing protein n=1 Tax=Amycolatopsis lexingtonensis TaxID=218822 RepID=A0ABR9HSH7_9PSEU|nr:hypothetical protein [Amycolatopsis lexingtonensis]MBE1493879.1 hypothetical protein [Amycolatopsis lexingtonensis]